MPHNQQPKIARQLSDEFGLSIGDVYHIFCTMNSVHESASESVDKVGYKPSEVAEMLSTSADWVVDQINNGSMKAANVGGGKQKPRWRVPVEEVESRMSRTKQVRQKRRTRRAKYSGVESFV